MPSFATPAPITATLDFAAGRVHLAAGDRTDTTVDVRPADPTRNRDVEAAGRTTVTCADGVLTVHAPRGRNLGPSGAIAVTVALPSGSHVEAATAGAEFDATGRLGAVTFFGAYHHIKLAEAGSVHLTATDGDIEIGRLDGPADISTARGDIRIADATRGTVRLTTRSGTITVGAGVSATLEAETTHGRIENTLKNNGSPALAIRATTSHGDIVAHAL
ncbi:DUF4097 family beta strand repeat-containing protein [Amycolatopsis sp. RTGN1]|uniref:DUF4097 family beta strand repeat-containing protein n=1 Tax=Amycolatopsis ponsaeliensis TaxID=2992142 RepID=UPI00254B3A4F|nr:DUF4097 family beta strand repeat-containing protein [Amycolatopsis sp. RTGN1]